MRLLALLTLAAAGIFASGPALSNDASWPSRPITLVVPLGAGGPTDVMARTLAGELQQRLGQSVVVDNKPGGGSLIATSIVARAKPDGYTFLFAVSAHTINPAVRRQVNYDPVKDFTPVGLVGAVPHVLVVGKELPVDDLRGLVELAKRKSDKLSYGSAGIGISNHLEGELLSSQIGAELVHVPYKGGSSEARQDLLAGRIDMLFDVVGNAVPFIKDGRLKAIGVAQAKRTKLAPDLPTLAESGLPQFDVMPWTGVFGPANVDPAVVDKFSRALLDSLKDDKIVDRLATLGIEAIGYGPKEFREFVIRDVKTWKDVASRARIELD